MVTPRTLAGMVSNAAPGAVRRAYAAASDIAGQFLGLSFITGLSITRGMTRPSGFSDEKLARLPRYLEGQIAAGALPGALTLIWRRGTIAHLSLVGEIDRERHLAMREDAIFR